MQYYHHVTDEETLRGATHLLQVTASSKWHR